MTLEILAALVVLELKHFLCDFPLQTEFMLKKGGTDRYVARLALAQHGFVHLIGAFVSFMLIALFFRFSLTAAFPIAAALAAANFASHFAIDYLKSHPQIGGRWKMPTKGFWNALGLDQMAHRIEGFIYLFILLRWGF